MEAVWLSYLGVWVTKRSSVLIALRLGPINCSRNKKWVRMGRIMLCYIPYFSDYKMHFAPQIWEENGGASYSLNVAYLACWGGGDGGGEGFFPLFSSSKT